MGFLRRLTGGGRVPDWADFMTREQYEAFDRALHADLQARGWRYRRDDDGVFAYLTAGEEPTVFGLTNVAQQSTMVAPSEVPELVRKHFDLTPRGIIDSLDLRRPIYRATAYHGHFGREDAGFPWERTDKAEALRRDASR